MNLSPKRLDCFHNIYACTQADAHGHIVLLHGWGLHSIVWDTIIPHLLQRYHVTVIDLPGMGQSPLPQADYTLDFLVEKVLSVAPESAIYIGWSLGGQIALRIASQHPERLSHLITVASTPKFTADTQDNWNNAVPQQVFDDFATLFTEDQRGALIRFLALQCKGSATYKKDVTYLKDILFFCGLPDPRALRGGLTVLKTSDLRPEVHAIQQPCLHIIGQNDHLIPRGIQENWKSLMPHATIVCINGAAHLPFLSHSSKFIATLERFLATDLSLTSSS